VNAGKAVGLLKECRFHAEEINPEQLLHQKEFYIRFHRTKARHLLLVKEQFALIEGHLSNGSSSPELREWLAKNVKGLGWKESSHFLRNIGHRDLAILDRHILKNLVRARVLRALPKTLTPKRYLSIEKKFKKFSERIGIPMDELDLLFWSMETGKILK
jgi:N-glycosylase/DNA lyase